MQFQQVIGQQSIKKHLISLVQQEKVPHVQLFLAQPGSGGLPLALAFAQYLTCENKLETDSCGVCNACTKAHKMIHPDIHYTYPTIRKYDSPKPVLSQDFIKEWRTYIFDNSYTSEYDWLQNLKAENKQGNISSDQAHIIISNLKLKPFEAKYKIEIIWMAEALKKEGNILLKILEEPPLDTVFILIAENQEELLPTILSRCQIVKINALKDEEIAEQLIKIGVTQMNAKNISFLANGNYSEALRLKDNDINYQTQNTTNFLTFAMRFNQPNMPENAAYLIKWIEDFAKNGRETVKDFLEYLAHIFRETILVKYNSNHQPKLNDEEKLLMERLVKVINYNKLADLIKLIDAKYYEIERNVNIKMVFTHFALELNAIMLQKKV